MVTIPTTAQTIECVRTSNCRSAGRGLSSTRATRFPLPLSLFFSFHSHPLIRSSRFAHTPPSFGPDTSDYAPSLPAPSHADRAKSSFAVCIRDAEKVCLRCARAFAGPERLGVSFSATTFGLRSLTCPVICPCFFLILHLLLFLFSSSIFSSFLQLRLLRLFLFNLHRLRLHRADRLRTFLFFHLTHLLIPIVCVLFCMSSVNFSFLCGRCHRNHLSSS